MAAKTVRIPISNFHLGGDYSGRFLVGAAARPMELLIDTGSSALALDGHKYKPDVAGGDKLTRLAQTASYGDGSNWTGAVINTRVSAGAGEAQVTLPNANVAIAYEESRDMFAGCDGILGLAYAPLDDAYQMPQKTWPKKYGADQVQGGQRENITPYLSQLENEGIVYEKVAFHTSRSITRVGHGGIDDPLNNGWMIIGGGEEAHELYTGAFSGVKVLADEWYNTRLKAIVVGGNAPIEVPARGQKGMPSNSIVDSGTNSLDLGPNLLRALFAKFPPAQQDLLKAAVLHDRVLTTSDVVLAQWPVITFVLQGEDGHADVRLDVAPGDYWQVDAYKPGAVLPAITQGDDGLAILGLPLMNGYYTLFDGVADSHRGVIRFAKAKR